MWSGPHLGRFMFDQQTSFLDGATGYGNQSLLTGFLSFSQVVACLEWFSKKEGFKLNVCFHVSLSLYKIIFPQTLFVF